MSTLADQTVVALENARLFENLRKLNKDLLDAQRALEEANRQMREIDEIKSNFISVITHELRTPLANVAFSLQLLEMYGMDRLLPEQKEQITQMDRGVKQAKTMVDNLITFAAFLNRQVALKLDRMDYKDIIQEALSPLLDKAKAQGLQLHLDIIGDLLPLIADRKHLVNAMYQLVDNAIKFNREGGKIWVSCWSTSEAAFFDVKDNGIGVSQTKLQEIWNGLTQMADPIRRGVEGLGLGLALVKYIIAAHGGQVWAESLESVGSQFGFRVPLDGPTPIDNRIYSFEVLNDIPRPRAAS
jgi:signal transduction histidine kinase